MIRTSNLLLMRHIQSISRSPLLNFKMFDIQGKVALITGGGSGIGFHCAQELLRNGLKVSLLTIS